VLARAICADAFIARTSKHRALANVGKGNPGGSIARDPVSAQGSCKCLSIENKNIDAPIQNQRKTKLVGILKVLRPQEKTINYIEKCNFPAHEVVN